MLELKNQYVPLADISLFGHSFFSLWRLLDLIYFFVNTLYFENLNNQNLYIL